MKLRHKRRWFWWAGILSGLLMSGMTLLVYNTYPRESPYSPSPLIVELLPVSEWGIGYTFIDGEGWARDGYTYGFVRLSRDYRWPDG